MKKFLSSVVIGTMLLTSVTFAAQVTERSDIEMVVNGNTIANENVPIIVNSRTLIPLRDLVTNLGVLDDNEHIIWNGEDRTVTIINDDTLINLTIDSDVATVNGVETKLDAPAMIYNDRTYIPARFVGEALNKKIGWDNYESRVLVRDMEMYEEVKNAIVKSDKVMSNVQKLKGTFSMDMGYEVSGSIMNMKNYIELDIPKKEMYSVIDASFMGMKSSLEQYFKNGNLYSNNETGIWTLISSEHDFNSILTSADSFTDNAIEDETIYDCLTIDYAKSNENVLVLKSDVKYAGLIEQATEIEGQSNITTEDIENIETLEVEYVINRENGNIESLTMLMIAFDESLQDNAYVKITLSISEFNSDFSVYCPIN